MGFEDQYAYNMQPLADGVYRSHDQRLMLILGDSDAPRTVKQVNKIVGDGVTMELNGVEQEEQRQYRTAPDNKEEGGLGKDYHIMEDWR